MKSKVLVVDDSQTVVKFVSLSLRARGYEIVTACDGMEAIEKLSATTGEVDLVITDLNMPNLDGYKLIETLRLNPQHKHTPIIILTSEEDEDDRLKGIKAGATAYLTKPFKPDSLLAEVDRQLDLLARVSG